LYDPEGLQTLDHIQISRNGIALEVTKTSGDPNWQYSCGSSTLTSADFFYQWTFEGEFTPEPSLGCAPNCPVFLGATAGNSLNDLQINPGTYAMGSKLVCRIRKTTSVAACNGENRCFYVRLELPISGPVSMNPGTGDGTESEQKSGSKNDEKSALPIQKPRD
jgi:hypothetical protein